MYESDVEINPNRYLVVPCQWRPSVMKCDGREDERVTQHVYKSKRHFVDVISTNLFSFLFFGTFTVSSFRKLQNVTNSLPKLNGRAGFSYNLYVFKTELNNRDKAVWPAVIT